MIMEQARWVELTPKMRLSTLAKKIGRENIEWIGEWLKDYKDAWVIKALLTQEELDILRRSRRIF